MTYSGKFGGWSDTFPVEVLPLVFELVLEEWPQFSRPTSERKLENRITHRFVGQLKRKMHGQYPFNFRFRTKLVEIDEDSESGELDIEVFTGLNTEVYFAFECKRLHTSPKNSRVSEYISAGGMGCFLTGQYDGCAGCAGMIGYVMDNRSTVARDAVEAAIKDNHEKLLLEEPKCLHATLLLPNESRLTQTAHLVNSKRFLIFHLFLPLAE